MTHQNILNVLKYNKKKRDNVSNFLVSWQWEIDLKNTIPILASKKPGSFKIIVSSILISV